MKRVFLDATCWMAAVGSAEGGSSAIISLAQAFLLLIVASQAVLNEAERNIKAKMGMDALRSFHLLLAETEIEICTQATLDEEEAWADLIVEKDRQVLASAFKTKADVLVTLDCKHVLTETVRANFPVLVQDTREFLMDFRSLLP